MKFIVSLLLTALLSFALCLFLPWWFIAVAAFLVALSIPQKRGLAFVLHHDPENRQSLSFNVGDRIHRRISSRTGSTQRQLSSQAFLIILMFV
jgi:hypothetical protein